MILEHELSFRGDGIIVCAEFGIVILEDWNEAPNYKM
jgi:hypothetical protein